MTALQQQSLFRQEAIAFQQHHRRWGEIVLLKPVATSVLSWTSVLSLLAVLIFVSVAQYARKETATGYLTPVSGSAKVFGLHDGVIQDLEVQQGQMVTKDQSLLTVRTDQTDANGHDVQAGILTILHNQRDVLQQQLAAEQARETSERNRLDTMLKGLHAQETVIDAQIASQINRIQLAQQLVGEATELHQKGYLSNLEYTSRLAGVIEQKQGLESLNQKRIQLRGDIAEMEAKIEQLPSTSGEHLQTLRNQLAATEERISQTEAQKAYTVRAPVAGRISLLSASVGQATDPKRMLLEIIPSNSKLEAELFVPAKAIGLIQIGQKVRLLYDAFPYQHYGTYKGNIVNISRSMLAPDPNRPVSIKESAYKVMVALDRQEVDARSGRIPLQPDMTLRADIILEKRPIIRLLLDPLLGTRL